MDFSFKLFHSQCHLIISLIANVTELEKQIADMELRFHREKDHLLAENGQLKSKIDHLTHQNIELDRKISALLK